MVGRGSACLVVALAETGRALIFSTLCQESSKASIRASQLCRFEKKVIVALRVECRIQVNKINGFGGYVVARNPEIVAIIKLNSRNWI
jgi:hypothetical protein